MLISASDWERYVNRLAAIDESVARQMRAYIEVNGYDHPDDIINIAYQLSTKYGEAAAEATCEMYDAIAAAQGVNVPAAEPARTPSLEETKDMIERVLNITHPEEYSKTVPAETSKLVKKTSTRTMRKNAARDGAKMALIPSGDGCAFCKMLGSRGWEDARASKSFEAHLHAHCRCEYCVRFNNDLSVDGYDPDELLEEYNSTGGKNAKEKLNLMRKAYREANKDKINAQKRAVYEEENKGYNEDVTRKEPIKLLINNFDKSDPLWRQAFSIEEEPGFENVAGHGNSKHFEVSDNGKRTIMTAGEYADYLRDSAGFHGQDLKFVSCSVGEGQDSFAQELSGILHIKVKAPNMDAYYDEDEGTVFIGSPFTNVGEWRVFDDGVEVFE